MTQPEISSLTRFGDAPFFVFCDHASNKIPEEMCCLGMPEDMLETHIAWDIGAGPSSARIAEKLSGRLFTCGFSRLVIDVNRALTANDLIPPTSDQIPIPGNQMLSAEQRKARISTFHEPYHQKLVAAVDDMNGAHAAPFFISIHSFTRRLMGAPEDRPWKIGVLWQADEDNAQAIKRWLEKETGWPIGDNEPYDARQFNYSVDRHIAARDLPHVTFEIRQDLINTRQGVNEIADLLASGIRDAAERHEGKARRA